MDKRKYNIFFHLHTVSGIVVSVGLYIIFFAGAFTLFNQPITRWEENPVSSISSSQSNPEQQLDVNKLTASLKKEGIDLYGRDIYVNFRDKETISLYLSGTADTSASEEAKKPKQLKLNTAMYTISNNDDHFSMGSLLYDLHFYYQLGRPGYYLSGAVALLFLFAIVTGILIHWDKIISKFYVFRPKEKWKTIWTDAHTALGTIGIPFQFLYAFTGAMFGLGILVSLSGSVLYGGDQEKFYNEVYGEHHDSLGIRKNISMIDLNAFIDSARNRWKGFEPTSFSISKYESSTMQFSVSGDLATKTKFLNSGEVVYDVFTGKVVHEHDPYIKQYGESVWPVVYRLHFADYGDIGTLENYLLKTVYFLMAIATCFVIISGVMIWLEARNKNSLEEKKKQYNKRVGYIYLSICLSMFPITAFSLIVSKLLPESVAPHREVILNSVFFGGWLLLSVFFFFRKDNYSINKYTLLSGACMGLCIPLLSGMISGSWLWNTYSNKQYDVFVMDIVWIILSFASLYAVWKIKRPEEKFS